MGRRSYVERSQKMMDEAVNEYVKDKVKPGQEDDYEISNTLTLNLIHHDLRDISITLAMICDKLIP